MCTTCCPALGRPWGVAPQRAAAGLEAGLWRQRWETEIWSEMVSLHFPNVRFDAQVFSVNVFHPAALKRLLFFLLRWIYAAFCPLNEPNRCHGNNLAYTRLKITVHHYNKSCDLWHKQCFKDGVLFFFFFKKKWPEISLVWSLILPH